MDSGEGNEPVKSIALNTSHLHYEIGDQLIPCWEYMRREIKTMENLKRLAPDMRQVNLSIIDCGLERVVI